MGFEMIDPLYFYAVHQDVYAGAFSFVFALGVLGGFLLARWFDRA